MGKTNPPNKNPEGLKPGWKVWRFDQIATNVNVRIDNPSESGMEHYVGLEHLDTDSLKIRRWGTPEDVEATKLMFKKGDIIFGRRRAYQRKLGVAEFDGICSAHAMVVRAKPEVVMPEFLPFFMQSDLFMARAVEISVGSLSPTINWKTMALQEFALPPLAAQQRISLLLLGLEDAADSQLKLANVAETATTSLAIDQLHVKDLDPYRGFPRGVPKGCVLAMGDEVFVPQSGNGEPEFFDPEGDCIFLKVSDFNQNDETSVIRGASRFWSKNSPSIKIFEPGTVVFPKRGASIFLNKVGILQARAALDPNLMAINYRDPKQTSPEFLYWLIKAIGLHRMADVTSVPQLNHKHLSPMRFALPGLNEQNEIVERLTSLLRAWKTAELRRSNTQRLKAQVIEKEIG